MTGTANPEDLMVSAPPALPIRCLKQLLTNPLSLYGDQEIICRGEMR